MKEWVGECANCHKPIYCLDGFLNGVIAENRTLYCFSCKDFADNVTDNNDSKEYGS